MKYLFKILVALSITVPVFNGCSVPSGSNAGLFIDAPQFTVESGYYEEGFSLEIESPTGGKIMFTTDGSIPSRIYGTEYTGPIAVTNSRTIRAMAFIEKKPVTSDSPITSRWYTITGTVLNPTFYPPGGFHTNGKEVSILCPTPDVTIHYTLDGSLPTREHGEIYTGSIFLEEDATIQAVAFVPDWQENTDSETVSVTYSFTGSVAPPAFSPPGGYYTNTQSVELTTGTTGAVIRYTTNGSTPSRISGVLYDGEITVSNTQTIRAVAYVPDWDASSDSGASSQAYTITGTVSNPTFSPSGGYYTYAKSVVLTCTTPGAVIKYTTNGTTPGRYNGSTYGASIYISSAATIRAMAYVPAWQENSDTGVTSSSYTITGKVSNPVITPTYQYHTGTFTAYISCSTPGATIRYTTNGDYPNQYYGTIYTGGFAVTSSKTIRAVAYVNGWESSSRSDVVSKVYTITGTVATPAISPAGGLSGTNKTVSISCATSGAVIRYTTNGVSPSRTYGTVYSGSFTLTSTCTVRAMAYVSAWESSSDSSEAATTYTIDKTPPVPGNGGDMSYGTWLGRTGSFSWVLATDNVSPQNTLRYRIERYEIISYVYNSSTGTFTAIWGWVALTSYTTNIDSQGLTDLTVNSSSDYRVAVIDQVNNVAYYLTHTGTTMNPFYLFRVDGTSNALGGRSGTDSWVRSYRTSNYSYVPSYNVHAFLSVGTADEIRDMINNYGYDTSYLQIGTFTIYNPVCMLYYINDTLCEMKIADSWGDMLDGSLDLPMSFAFYPQNEYLWYSGSTSTGALSSGYNCNAFNTSSSSYRSTVGNSSFSNSYWIQRYTYSCGNSSVSYMGLAQAEP